MFSSDDPLRTRSLAPQPPLPPEIEGYLKKLKRKTSNLTGSWNKRWFFVDPKRLEFGYSATKAPNMPRSSIYLNDITAVLQFDDTHFQVESRTRNFFLCGESKASTTCWVKSLDEYRKKLIEYEKELAKCKAMAPPPTATATATVITGSNQPKGGADTLPKKAAHAKKKSPHATENPARDSQQDSSTASLGASASSSSNLADEKPLRYVAVDQLAASDEHRTPSPIDAPRRREAKLKGLTNTGDRARDRERDDSDRDKPRGREYDSERPRERVSRDRKPRDRERERGRGRDDEDDRASKRDRSTSAQHRGNAKPAASASGSSAASSSGRAASRTGSNSSNAGYAAHPTHGYVMHAWVDEYD